MWQQSLGNLILAAVAGIMLFFSVAVAPGIFKVLPQEWASTYVRAFFPKYYAVLGALCGLAALLVQPRWEWSTAAVCAVLFLLSWLILTPAINRARDRGHERRFLVLHLGSVALNLLQLLALLAALYAFALA